MTEPFTGREDLTLAQMASREELLQEAIGDALMSLGRQIKQGIPLEECKRLDTDSLKRVYGYPTTFRDTLYLVFGDVRDLLIERRDKRNFNLNS